MPPPLQLQQASLPRLWQKKLPCQRVCSSAFLRYHANCRGRAFFGADAAALAVEHIIFKIPFRVLPDARLRAEQVTDPALDAAGLVPDRTLGFPVTGFV